MNNKPFKSLKELILENPELPRVITVWNDDCDPYESTTSVFFNNKAEKKKIYCYKDAKDDTVWDYSDDIELIEDYYRLAFEEKEEYAELSDDEYTKAILNFMKENVKSYDAIVIHADN